MRINFNHLNRFVIIVALCLLIFQSASAQNPSASPQSTQQIAVKVDEYMNAAMRFDRFSGSILVARDGSPIVSRGYVLGVIVERTSGKSYADFLQENIFTPLGMTRSGYDDNSRIIKNRAAGYLRQSDAMTNAP